MNQKTQELRIKHHLSVFAMLCEKEHQLRGKPLDLTILQRERKLLRALLVGLGVSEVTLNDIAFHVRSNGEGNHGR